MRPSVYPMRLRQASSCGGSGGFVVELNDVMFVSSRGDLRLGFFGDGENDSAGFRVGGGSASSEASGAEPEDLLSPSDWSAIGLSNGLVEVGAGWR